MNAQGERPKRVKAGASVYGKPKPVSKREATIAARILTERKAIEEMAVKIRRNSKELAASAERLLRRVS